jgi:hypothetical protein
MVIQRRGKRTIVEKAKSIAVTFIDCFCRPGDHSGDFDVYRREQEIPDVLLARQIPTVDEIFLYHIIFCGYPGIPVAFLSFFSQMRQ